MRKILRLPVVMLAVLALFGLAACDDDEDVPVVTDDEETTTSAPEDTDTTAAEGQAFTADLTPLNNSGASGTATVEVQDGSVTVTVESSGVSAGAPHAQHIHIGGQNTCPDMTDAAMAGEDGLISTAEGAPAYGAVQVSLTTTGDVGADSALAVDRFPVASADGTISYSRTFELPAGVTAEDIANGVIVQHGIAKLFGDEAAYDGEPRSSLDPSLPLEATIPALCGALSQS